VILFNRANGTFEFIGQPQPLEYGERKGPQNVGDVISAVRAWLKKNDRITFREIFRSLDKDNFGDLKEKEFLAGFERIGIRLQLEETRLLKEKLDLKHNNLYELSPLLKAISGIPTKQFLPLSMLKLATFVRTKDWSRDTCIAKLNPENIVGMDINKFKKSLSALTSSSFVLSDLEIEEIFGVVTKQPREKWQTVARLEVEQLVEQVMEAIDAIIIEEVRQELRRKQLHLVDLIHKHDANKDGVLTLNEVDNMLDELGVSMTREEKSRFFKDAGRVSTNFLQSYFGDDARITVSEPQALDFEPSRENPQKHA
jgi:Ca2+-binding EF-hand superfamily protein